MKKIALSLLIIVNITTAAFSQNVGIGTLMPVNKLDVVSTVTAPSVASILGINYGVTGTAIVGSSTATNTRGVVGSSNNGYGIQSYTNNNIGMSGYSLSGYGLYASSSGGLALQISGDLKFSGGNTNPADGAVLTSDAVGNATWKKSNIAFLGKNAVPANFASGVFKKVEFVDKTYDLKGNFLDYNGGSTPTTSSIFTAPVAGVYHFSSNLTFSKTTPDSYYFDYADIKLTKNGSSLAIYRGHNVLTPYSESTIYLQIVGDFHLEAGDKIWIEASQNNGLSTTEPIEQTARFSGHLVVAD